VKDLNENNICMQFIGDRTAFSEKLQQKITTSEELTKSNTGLVTNRFNSTCDKRTTKRSLNSFITSYPGTIRHGEISLYN